MQEIKKKLQDFLEKEVKAKIKFEQDIEKRYTQQFEQDVITIVSTIFRVLVSKEENFSMRRYIYKPHDFFREKLPQFDSVKCYQKVEEFFNDYTPELKTIFDDILLGSIRKIRGQNSDPFVYKMLGHIDAELCEAYNLIKDDILKNNIIQKMFKYQEIIEQYISLLKKEENGGLAAALYLIHLCETVDLFISELKETLDKDLLNETELRYFYFYVNENLLSKF